MVLSRLLFLKKLPSFCSKFVYKIWHAKWAKMKLIADNKLPISRYFMIYKVQSDKNLINRIVIYKFLKFLVRLPEFFAYPK
jgi:hypothetical protein